MEDLGEGENLQDTLNSPDPTAAYAALQTLAVQMARLHGATVEKQELFEAIRDSLPETNELGCHHEVTIWLENREKISGWFRAVDYMPPPGFDLCLTHVANIYGRSEEFLGFTHGDPAPSNNHFAQGQARLLDFEYGGFRHVLYDITAWDILCPLPVNCMRGMSNSFREELMKTYPSARDERHFTEAWACLCAYRALAILTWIPLDIINQNRPWADNWTMREAVLAAVSRLERVTAPFAQLGAISEAAGILTKELRFRWPEFESADDVLPQWSALKNG
jgi:hypothetical protein